MANSLYLPNLLVTFDLPVILGFISFHESRALSVIPRFVVVHIIFLKSSYLSIALGEILATKMVSKKREEIAKLLM